MLARTALRSFSSAPPPAANPYKHLTIPQINSLKWSSQSYEKFALKPHIHPGEWKVSVRAEVASLGLDEVGKENLKRLVGPRWEGNKGTVRLTCEQFGSRVENKRWCVSTLNKLVGAAREGKAV